MTGKSPYYWSITPKTVHYIYTLIITRTLLTVIEGIVNCPVRDYAGFGPEKEGFAFN